MDTVDAFTCQAAAELAFAKSMGWNEDLGRRIRGRLVRGYRVQWKPDSRLGLVVHDDDDDEAKYVLVTGQPPTFTIHGWITVGEAKQRGGRIGEG